MELNSGVSQPVAAFRRVFDLSEKLANAVGVGLIFFIVLSITVDIIVRTITGSSITGVYELNELLMVGCFLVLAYTQKEKGHVVVDVLISHLSSKPRHYVEMVALSLTLIVCVLFFWQSIVQALTAIQMKLFTEGIISYQLWPARLVVSIGFLLMCIRLLFQWIDLVSKKI